MKAKKRRDTATDMLRRLAADALMQIAEANRMLHDAERELVRIETLLENERVEQK